MAILQDIDALCAQLDVAQWGVLTAKDVPTEHLRARYAKWLGAGNGGALKYVDERLDIICDPFGARPWAKAAVVLAFRPVELCDSPLLSLPPAEKGGPCATIAEYALNEDYHITGQRILRKVAESLGRHEFECCVDSSPVPEKELLRLAGIGAADTPNSLARVAGCGCRAHIGVMFTSIAIPSCIRACAPDCCDCRACQRCCPNHAMTGDGDIHVRLCRSWLASEWHGPLTREQQLMLHGTLFGCSLCSSCCPDDSQACNDLRVNPLEILRMPTASLRRILATTTISHVSPSILKRNAVAAIAAQSADSERNSLLMELLPLSSSPTVRQTIDVWM